MKLKIYAVNGGSITDYELENDLVCGGSNAHSAGAVVIAEDLEEARKLLDKAIIEENDYDLEERYVLGLKEIKLKKGILLLADGSC